MTFKRILSIQDISCVGQCSMTVALPILSACGIETAILPSAVLSTHTGGFTGFTVRNLADDMPAINRHWQKEGITFNAVYTGYLGSKEQVQYVLDIRDGCMENGGLLICDPAMADNGKLYYGFDMEYVEAMKRLCVAADIILPNITEACMLCGMEYKEEYDRSYIEALMKALTDMGAKKIVLTGVALEKNKTGSAVYENGVMTVYQHRRYEKGCHGTGDIYASAFTGALMNGIGVCKAAEIAADYTVDCIGNTQSHPDHWYGAMFEQVLPQLIEAIKTNA